MSLPSPLIDREPGFILVHSFPAPDIETRWRAFMNRADVPCHHVSPEFFLEPFFKNPRPFAALSISGSEVKGVATGIHQDNAIACGIPPRPQVALDKTADRAATTESNEDYSEYYSVHQEWCLRKGIPRIPLEVFEEACKLREIVDCFQPFIRENL